MANRVVKTHIDHQTVESFGGNFDKLDSATGAYVQDLLDRGNFYTHQEVTDYFLARLKLIGYTKENPCNIYTWYQMDGVQDPLVVAVVELLRELRMKQLEATFEDDEVVESLITMTHWNGMGTRLNGHQIEPPSDVIALNNLVVIFATSVEAYLGESELEWGDDYLDTGASPESLAIAASVLSCIMDSYPVSKLTEPELS